MIPFWTLDRVAQALARRMVTRAPTGSTAIGNISTDTRTVCRGDLFLALVGDNFDGHEFVSAAVDAGASAVVVSTPIALGTVSVPVYVVDDTLLALAALATFARAAWGGPVVAIAGSNGKTSTKELARAALGQRLSVHATTGNLNNRVGVPLTLLAIPSEADVAVIEIGTSLPGEIEILRDIARPDITILTAIAEEHLEGLGDLDGVLQEETAAFDGVGVAIVPVHELAAIAAAGRKARRVVTAGLGSGDVAAREWSIAEDGSGSVAVDGVTVRSPLKGEHNLRNLMLAIAVARELGVATEDVAAGVANMPQPPMRAAWQKIGNTLVINDAYNSNPGSARAALEMLSAAPGKQKVAILGTMRELGAGSDHQHDEIARAAISSNAALIGTVGDFTSAFQRIAPGDKRVVTASNIEELWTIMQARIEPSATILLKASRGVKLERMLPLITTWAEQNC